MVRVFVDMRPLADLPAGIPIYTLKLVENLAAFHGRVSVVTGQATLRPWKARQLAKLLHEHQLDVPIVNVHLPTRVAERAGRITGKLLRRHAELVHGTNYLCPSWIRGLPSVITVHDLAFLRFPVERFSPWAELATTLVEQAPLASVVVTVSEFTKREAVDLLGLDPARVVVTPLATQWSVGEKRLAHALRSEDGERKGSAKYLLTVGTLSPRKNYEGLLRAFATLRSRQADARLVVVGSRGWGDEAIVDMLSRMTCSVEWISHCSGSKLRRLYREARAFVLPSWYEGFGIPVLEAMEMGCPVCYASGSALGEVAGDAGLEVDPGDGAQIADAMERLWLDDELCAELGRRGERESLAYSWRRTSELTIAAYEKAREVGVG